MAGAVTKDRLKIILEEDKLQVTLSADGKEIEIAPRLYFTVAGGMKARGYDVTVGGVTTQIKNFPALTAWLSKAGAGGDDYPLIEISGGYKSVAELDEQLSFDNISMADLLKKYPQADEFELVNPHYDGALTDEQAENAFGDIAEAMRKASLTQYQSLTEEERAKLPDFDTLYSIISEECEQFCKKHAKEIDERDGNNFFGDEFNCGNTAFTEPQGLWHIYNAVDFIQVCNWQNKRLKDKKEGNALGYEIENNPVLKDALISIRITYYWHCTACGSPAKLFRFKLNDKTRAWLLTHRDDYDFENEVFEDLALYKGDKILFSSCTHEKFHTDCDK